MRTKDEIREQFIAIARETVRKAFRKRVIAKMNFAEEEMEKIKEIDEFLKMMCEDNREELVKSLDNYKKYLCIVVKVSIKCKGEDMSTFIHQYIDMQDFYYKKIEYYIAKAVWTISKNRHAEVFFCVNGLRARCGERGIILPERKKRNVCQSSLRICRLGFA